MSEPRAIWTCSVCAAQGHWTDDWRWYGSLGRFEQTGEPEFVACSPACRKTDAAKLLIAAAEKKPKPRNPPSARKPRLSEAERLRRDIEAMQQRLQEIDP
ncbi:MAG: hypothetical protein ABR616_15465 [Dermatophilaceae bacterium]